MGLIQNLIKGIGKNRKEFKEKFKQVEEDMKINRLLEERQKSANERELEKYIKQEREAEIKRELDKIHSKQNRENWKSPNLILNQKATMLRTDRPILKEKNIFIDNRNDIPFTQKGRMFFKW
jgi:Sec-independent protein translocase protein TatA